MDWQFVLETISKSSPVFDNRQGKGPAQDEYDMNTETAHEVYSMVYCEMYYMPLPIVLY